MYSKQYCTLRAQEKTHFSVREYVQADKCRREADALEIMEKVKHKLAIKVEAEKEVEKMKKRQIFQKESMMKRIRRERDEQLIDRLRDMRTLTKRNKIELTELLQKQQYEISTLTQFMRFSLGRRAPKDPDGTTTPVTILDDDATDIARAEDAE